MIFNMLNQGNGLGLWLLITFPATAGSSSGAPLRVSIPGDISMGGLIPLHEPTRTRGCSPTISVNAMQLLEALLFAVDRINANKTVLPNITLGVQVLDTCGSATVALRRAVKEFVMGNAWSQRGRSCANYTQSVFGVIGPAISYEAIYVTPYLNLFEIPLISFSATSSVLSNKHKYEYFSRTVPSDISQTQAIVDLLVYFNWRYVSVVYTDETYGLNGYDGLIKQASGKGICFANKTKLIIPKKYDKKKYRKVVAQIFAKDMPTVLVIFCSQRSVIALIKEIQEHPENAGALHIVASESLSAVIDKDGDDAVNKIAKEVLFLSLAASVEDFHEYFFNLTPASNKRNPWFKTFYQAQMNCTFQKNQTENIENKEMCRHNQTLQSAQTIFYNKEIPFLKPVIDGVYAFAHALTHILERRCGNGSSNSCIPLNEIPGKELLDTIRGQTFDSPSGYTVNITSSGDVLGGYNVYYSGNASGVSYKRLKVGEWRDQRLNLPSSTWKENYVHTKLDCSHSQSCGTNQILQKVTDNADCCWECKDCALQSLAVNKTLCKPCPKGFLPDKTFQTCTKIKAKYFSLDGKIVSIYLAVIPIIMSILGFAVLSFVAFVFVKYRNTPLVKASGREHSFLLFLGLLSAFFFPFVAVLKPSPFVCFWRFILKSLSITVCYVAIVVKNNRIYRIFNSSRGLTTKPAFVRPKSQMVISLALISFQVLLLLALIIHNFPRDQLFYPSSTEVHQACVWSLTQSVVSHAYNIILLICCTYYAYKTKDIPQNYNEAKYIAFAMYASCVTAVAYAVITVTISSALNAPIKISAVSCFYVTFAATILLVCFFIPKLHVIVWKPEANVKLGRVTESDSATTQEKNEMEESRRHGNVKNSIETSEEDVDKIATTNTRSTQTDCFR